MTKAQEAVWTRLDWSKIQYKVSRLQSKIYQASLTGDKISVVKYQKILINSYSAKLLAIKKVTQDNKGKKNSRWRGMGQTSPKPGTRRKGKSINMGKSPQIKWRVQKSRSSHWGG